MGFIRVRSAGGPLHEFDISEAAYKRNKQAYVVVDKTPVGTSRQAKIVTAKPVVKAAPAAEGKE
ncbi:hypothetical protein MUN76_15355 [Leucobacter rhizosphaerae]|uniref:Uncharacterized protein n=1 Tax=Leucobacter rhizosphaerae TaxID=2932245 RepID=A0ABY4FVT2_9MICO|nr:hypothetical protein [Leucobacter rhizosphaerae]UOQ60385.1 hypothetical protein MUN76_15355 [Leucobacter rhizosphaerae]